MAVTVNPEMENFYNARAAIPDQMENFARWPDRSAALRDAYRCRLDVAYGDSARQAMDIFPATVATAQAPEADLWGRIVCYAPASGRQSAVGRTTGDDPTLDTCMHGDGLDRPDYGFNVRAAQGSRAKMRCAIGSKAERGMVS